MRSYDNFIFISYFTCRLVRRGALRRGIPLGLRRWVAYPDEAARPFLKGKKHLTFIINYSIIYM